MDFWGGGEGGISKMLLFMATDIVADETDFHNFGWSFMLIDLYLHSRSQKQMIQRDC